MPLIILKLILYLPVKRALSHIIKGRNLNPDSPEIGRFNHKDISKINHDLWNITQDILPSAQLSKYKIKGNRLNAFLSILTLASYRAFINFGTEKKYASELVSDTAWKLYILMLKLPKLIATLLYRNKQKRMNFILKLWLIFPFAEPKNKEQPGYHRKIWIDNKGLHSHWYQCPPLDVVNQIGTPEEKTHFTNSWCIFDYAIAKEMVPGGYFYRPHCLSKGDSVCDMTWAVQKTPATSKINHCNVS